ncbi:MAG: hypothetical protein WD059_15130 [Balneolaceae bacterium]
MDAILNSVALLFTAFTVLYSLWYSEINGAKELKPGLHEENDDRIEQIKIILYTKVIPLLVFSILMLAIHFNTTYRSISNIHDYWFGNYYEYYTYDPIMATFMIIQLLFFLGFIRLLVTSFQLYSAKKNIIKEKTPQ